MAGEEQFDGLKKVFLENRAILLRFLVARTGDQGNADDLLQDVWIKLETLRIGPVAEPLSYLFRMAQNAVLDKKRSDQRRSARDTLWQTDVRAAASYNGADLTATAEEQLVLRERLNEVEAALGRLPERTSYIFRRYRVDKISQKQIAGELAISVSAVEKHLQKAYKTIVKLKFDAEAGK